MPPACGFESHYPHQNRKDTHRGVFFVLKKIRTRTDPMQMSGGHLLVAGLDGDNTIIFFPLRERKCKSSPVIRTKKRQFSTENCRFYLFTIHFSLFTTLKREAKWPNTVKLRLRVIPSQCAHWRGNPQNRWRLPHQSDDWFAMTCKLNDIGQLASLFVLLIPARRRRCRAGSRCPSGRSALRGCRAR